MKTQFYANLAKVSLFAFVALGIFTIAFGISFYVFCFTVVTLSLIAIIPVKLMLRRIDKKLQLERDKQQQKIDEKAALLKRKEAERLAKRKRIKSRILAKNPINPKTLVTVCNLKQQVVWGDEFISVHEVASEILSNSYNDVEIEKTLSLLESVLEFVKKEKKLDKLYAGEKKLNQKIETCKFEFEQYTTLA